MPEADDAADLAAAEADVRRRFRDDFRAAGGTGAPAAPGAHDVSGDVPGGRRPAAAVDYSTLSPLQQIAVGLRDARAAHDAPRGAPTPQPRRPEGGPEQRHDRNDGSAFTESEPVPASAAGEFFGAD